MSGALLIYNVMGQTTKDREEFEKAIRATDPDQFQKEYMQEPDHKGDQIQAAINQIEQLNFKPAHVMVAMKDAVHIISKGLGISLYDTAVLLSGEQGMSMAGQVRLKEFMTESTRAKLFEKFRRADNIDRIALANAVAAQFGVIPARIYMPKSKGSKSRQHIKPNYTPPKKKRK